jgi:hypothetical protein
MQSDFLCDQEVNLPASLFASQEEPLVVELFQSVVPCSRLNVCVGYLTGKFRTSGFAQLHEFLQCHPQTDIEWSDKQHRLERFVDICSDWETLLVGFRNQFKFV